MGGLQIRLQVKSEVVELCVGQVDGAYEEMRYWWR